MKKKEIPESFVMKGIGYYRDFEKYHSSDVFKEYRGKLREKKFTVSNTEITYRMVNHWEENGLLPDGVAGGDGWRKFTLVELVWTKAIIRMRQFGLSLEKIKQVKESLMKFDKKDGTYLLFEYYVARALSSSDDPYILIFSNGDSNLACATQIELTKVFRGHFDVLLISLKSILEKLNLSVGDTKFLDLLSDEEGEMLSEIRSGDNKEVRARVNGGKITELETKKVYSAAPSLEKINKEIKDGKSFAEVVTRYENGVKQSAEVRTRKRL